MAVARLPRPRANGNVKRASVSVQHKHRTGDRGDAPAYIGMRDPRTDFIYKPHALRTRRLGARLEAATSSHVHGGAEHVPSGDSWRYVHVQVRPPPLEEFLLVVAGPYKYEVNFVFICGNLGWIPLRRSMGRHLVVTAPWTCWPTLG